MKISRAFESALLFACSAVLFGGCGGNALAPVAPSQSTSGTQSLLRQPTTSQPQLLLAFGLNNAGGPIIAIYRPGMKSMVGHIGPDHGIVEPVDAALDPSNNLFVSDTRKSEVFEFAYPYAHLPIATLHGLPNLSDVHLDGKQNLYANTFKFPSETVYKFTPPYTGKPLAINISGGSEGFAVDSSGDLFYTDGSYDLVELSPPYASAPRTIAHIGNFGPPYMDQNNNLWTPTGPPGAARGVEEFVPPYSSRPAVTIRTGTTQAYSVTLDTNGNLFFEENHTIRFVSPPYTGTLRSCCHEALGYKGNIAVNSNGGLYAITSNSSGFGEVWEWTGNYSGSPQWVTIDNASYSFSRIFVTH